MHTPIDLVTLVIQHQIRPNTHAQYEAWLKDIARESQRFPGHMGVNIIRPHGAATTYAIVLRFDSHEHLTAWIDSDTRRALLARVEPLFLRAEEVEIETGLEYWFTPPVAKPLHARPYKQFLVTLSAIFPLTLIVPWTLHPLARWLPVLSWPLVARFADAAVVVALMVYVIMPRYTRRVASWLFR